MVLAYPPFPRAVLVGRSRARLGMNRDAVRYEPSKFGVPTRPWRGAAARTGLLTSSENTCLSVPKCSSLSHRTVSTGYKPGGIGFHLFLFPGSSSALTPRPRPKNVEKKRMSEPERSGSPGAAVQDQTGFCWHWSPTVKSLYLRVHLANFRLAWLKLKLSSWPLM